MLSEVPIILVPGYIVESQDLSSPLEPLDVVPDRWDGLHLRGLLRHELARLRLWFGYLGGVKVVENSGLPAAVETGD